MTRLQLARLEAGYDRADDFADVAGISRHTYAMWERQGFVGQEARVRDALAVAGHLGRSVDFVVGFADE